MSPQEKPEIPVYLKVRILKIDGTSIKITFSDPLTTTLTMGKQLSLSF